MLQKFLAIAVISLFFACSEPDDNSTPNPIDSNTPEEFLGRWVSGSPLPTPRQEMPHAVLNGKIYVRSMATVTTMITKKFPRAYFIKDK